MLSEAGEGHPVILCSLQKCVDTLLKAARSEPGGMAWGLLCGLSSEVLNAEMEDFK